MLFVQPFTHRRFILVDHWSLVTAIKVLGTRNWSDEQTICIFR